jgi:2-methylcitrate dehydratase PrpD
VACGKILNLNEEQMRMALGIAASCSGALRAGHGTMTKGLHSGNAAAQGMMSAILASRGFGSGTSIRY